MGQDALLHFCDCKNLIAHQQCMLTWIQKVRELIQNILFYLRLSFTQHDIPRHRYSSCDELPLILFAQYWISLLQTYVHTLNLKSSKGNIVKNLQIPGKLQAKDPI